MNWSAPVSPRPATGGSAGLHLQLIGLPPGSRGRIERRDCRPSSSSQRRDRERTAESSRPGDQYDAETGRSRLRHMQCRFVAWRPRRYWSDAVRRRRRRQRRATLKKISVGSRSQQPVRRIAVGAEQRRTGETASRSRRPEADWRPPIEAATRFAVVEANIEISMAN